MAEGRAKRRHAGGAAYVSCHMLLSLEAGSDRGEASLMSVLVAKYLLFCLGAGSCNSPFRDSLILPSLKLGTASILHSPVLYA
jgi:hypothetical protein